MQTFNTLDQVATSLRKRRWRDVAVAGLFALGLLTSAAAVESTARTAMGKPSAADWAMGPARATAPAAAAKAPAEAPAAPTETPAAATATTTTSPPLAAIEPAQD